MSKLANRARMTTATTGTGTITLGAATTGHQSFAAAGIVAGDRVRYVIEEGAAWEIGLGIYGAAGPTLTRGPVASSGAGAEIALAGSAVVFITAVAEDIASPAEIQVFATPGPATWVKPDGARLVEVVAIGGGGGAGAGRKGASGTVCGGGGGGGGGARSWVGGLPAALLDATETVIVGAVGTGGASAVADNSNGAAGTAGGVSSFGQWLAASGGSAGAGGTASGNA